MWWLILVIIFVGWAIVSTLENNKQKELELKERELKMKCDELALNPQYSRQQELKEIAQRELWEQMMLKFAEEEKNAKNENELKLIQAKHLKEHMEFWRKLS